MLPLSASFPPPPLPPLPSSAIDAAPAADVMGMEDEVAGEDAEGMKDAAGRALESFPTAMIRARMAALYMEKRGRKGGKERDCRR